MDMSFGLIIYLIGLSDNLSNFSADIFVTISLIMFFTVFGSIITAEDGRSFKDKLTSCYPKAQIITLVTSALLANVLPNKETSYMILAATGVEIVVENEKVKSIAGKSLEAIEKQLDAYLEANKKVEE
jgi:hypothetical protein